MNKAAERLYNGLVKENPTFVLMLGMCPTLAVTTLAVNGIGMGLTTTVILALSNVMISALRKVIPDGVRMPAYTGQKRDQKIKNQNFPEEMIFDITSVKHSCLPLNAFGDSIAVFWRCGNEELYSGHIKKAYDLFLSTEHTLSFTVLFAHKSVEFFCQLSSAVF